MSDDSVPKKQLQAGGGGSGRKRKTAVGSGDGREFDFAHSWSAGHTPSDAPELRVCICERSDLIRAGYRATIAGFAEVIGETDGRGALELVTDLQPDLVITDLELETIEGIELIRESRVRLPDQKFVVATDLFYATKYFYRITRIGSNSICLKSAGSKVLLRAIEAAISDQEYHEPEVHRLVKQDAQNSTALLTDEEIAVLIRLDMRNIEIAGELNLDAPIIQKRIDSVLAKLKIPSRTAAALKAVQLGYVLLPQMPVRDELTNLTLEQIEAEKQAQDALRRHRNGESQYDY